MKKTKKEVPDICIGNDIVNNIDIGDGIDRAVAEEMSKSSGGHKVKTLMLSLRVVHSPIEFVKPRIEFDIKELGDDDFDMSADHNHVDFSDGSRYIVMNNEDTIVYAYYSAVASFQMHREYHVDLEKALFEKMREILGFKRKY